MYQDFNSLMQTPEMVNALIGSSVSVDDAQCRLNEYAKIFSRSEEINRMSPVNLLQKTFSGYAETPLLSTQYFNASVASFVSSFAGFMSVERDFEQPTGLFYWYDVLGVTNMRTILPNLGPDQYQDIQSMGTFTSEVAVSGTAYTEILGRKIIPSTLRVKVVDPDGGNYELIDNGQGQLMAIAGKLATSSINYLNGKVEFTLGAAPAAADGKNPSITIVGKEDVVGTPCNTNGASNAHAYDKRVLGKLQQIALTTVPDMLVAEYDIPSLAAVRKSIGGDMAAFLFGKLRELYTKIINYRLVSTLEEGYNGNVMNDLDMTVNSTDQSGKFMDYRSRIDLFDSYLIEVESEIAKKSFKACKTTAYVAGNRAANQFQKGGQIGKWEKNTNMTYVNDLLGWYNGIPVLRSLDVNEDAGEGTFYAIHKTDDGQMAPLARGIFMPLTDTPTVGSYDNPAQMASGIFYQEGVRYMAPELVQKVTFKAGR